MRDEILLSECEILRDAFDKDSRNHRRLAQGSIESNNVSKLPLTRSLMTSTRLSACFCFATKPCALPELAPQIGGHVDQPGKQATLHPRRFPGNATRAPFDLTNPETARVAPLL
jgi:hypothetical protein